MNDPKKNLYHRLFWKPIAKQKSKLIALVGALLFMGIAQSLLLFLLGPMLKGLFGGNGNNLLTASELFSPQILKIFPFLSNHHIAREDLQWIIPIGLLSAGFLRNLASYLYELNAAALSLICATNYRYQFFKDLLHSPYQKISEKSPAQWMSHMMNDVLFLQARFTDIMRTMIEDSTMMLAALISVWLIHWPTGLVLSIFAPVIGVFAGRTGKKISGFAHNYQKDLAFLANTILSLRKRFEFVRAQKGEQCEQKHFMLSNKKYLDTIRRSIAIRAAFAPGVEFIGFVIFSLLILFIKNLSPSSLQGVDIFIFFAALGIMLRPLKNIGEQLTKLHETIGSLNESLNLFRTAEQLQQNSMAKALPLAKKSHAQNESITVSKLQVTYNHKTVVMVEDLHINKGQSIALIGSSGAGKSTLIKAISGLISPDSFHGSSSSLEVAMRANLVSQSPFLFAGSLRENLCYGLASQAKEITLVKACEDAGLKKLKQTETLDFGQKYNPLSPNLSGGQIQRLAIARALLRNKDILLLDEATASVDRSTEKDILKTLINHNKKDHSYLIAVTHRLEQLELFDQIWFMQQGRIILKGHHHELMQEQEYANFVAGQ